MINYIYIMGDCLSNKEIDEKKYQVSSAPVKSKIEDVDIVKVKLKTARDRINNFINAKNRDVMQLDAKINQKLPAYQQTGNKKQLVPLLKAKKDLKTFIQNAQIRARLINDKLAEVQMQKVNIDTINALEDSNKYIKFVQQQLERKDWKNVLEQAKNKYQLDWPEDDQNIQSDPKFQQLWNEIGGNKIPVGRQVNVLVPQNNNSQQIITPNNRGQQSTRIMARA